MLLFVYGTLKKGYCRHHILHGKFIGNVETQPLYKLYDTGNGFPALVKSDEGRAIKGELWEINQDMIDYLDIIEGVSFNLYKRDTIHLSDGTEVTGYLWQRSIHSMKDCGHEWTE